ncbi:MAG: NAD(P) transhydrogenase subunit alpha [Acholeplasmataceae bacterium]|jgi:NAD(P) transhydrogenase subunit alpha
MIIGIPKEILKGEKRVSATPQTVKKMIQDGHQVFVEKNAGVNSFYLDDEYLEAGAIVLEDVIELYNKSEVILKVKEPQINEKVGKHEIDMMRENAILITFLHPANHYNHKMVLQLRDKGITSFTLDGVPRISRAQSMDALSSMSTCAGYKGVMIAANNLPKFLPMIGSAVGMIRPGNVFVVGCGVAGLRAIATAKGLGAQVYASDIRQEAVEQAKSLGARIVELNIPNEVAVSSDGKHANTLPKEYLLQEREQIKEAVKNADIIILSALVFGKEAQVLVTEEMVKLMKPGSYIVDISIDQGGNCALTKPAEIVEVHGVKIDGTKNIPGMIPTSSTYMFSENIYNFFKYLVRDNKLYLDMSDEIVASTIVTYNYKLLHEGTIEAMNV